MHLDFVKAETLTVCVASLWSLLVYSTHQRRSGTSPVPCLPTQRSFSKRSNSSWTNLSPYGCPRQRLGEKAKSLGNTRTRPPSPTRVTRRSHLVQRRHQSISRSYTFSERASNTDDINPLQTVRDRAPRRATGERTTSAPLAFCRPDHQKC